MYSEMNGNLSGAGGVGGSEGQVKRKKLSSLLRTLSATAASSSARMTTRSAGDQSLMVETSQSGRNQELAEDEAPDMKHTDRLVCRFE